jgi:hypothetical protein
MWRRAPAPSLANSQFSDRHRLLGHDSGCHALGVSAGEFFANRAQLSLLKFADRDPTTFGQL